MLLKKATVLTGVAMLGVIVTLNDWRGHVYQRLPVSLLPIARLVGTGAHAITTLVAQPRSGSRQHGAYGLRPVGTMLMGSLPGIWLGNDPPRGR